jgi:phospholipase/carboxylesterase
MSRLSTLLETGMNRSESLSRHRSSSSRLPQSVQYLDFPHRFFVPEAYESSYEYPLIVWLHSDGSCETELDNVMQALSTRNYVAIAPRANIKSRGSERYCWGSTHTDCGVAEELVWESVQSAVDQLSIDPNRIFLAGFGGGASMAQWIGLKYANQIAGVISLSGAFPKTTQALSNWKRARELSVLFTQCEGSTICSDQEMVRAIRIAHQSGLKYQFVQGKSPDGCSDFADDLDSSMLAVANRFAMSIVTGTDICLQPEPVCESEGIEFGFN